jgi:hypothetical protein
MFRPIHCKPVCYFDVKSSFFLDICVQGKDMDDGYTVLEYRKLSRIQFVISVVTFACIHVLLYQQQHLGLLEDGK